jgi:ribosome recycling factor
MKPTIINYNISNINNIISPIISRNPSLIFKSDKNKILIPKIDLTKIIKKKGVRSISKNGKKYIVMPDSTKREDSNSKITSKEKNSHINNDIINTKPNKLSGITKHILYKPKREVNMRKDTNSVILPTIKTKSIYK